MRPLTCHLPHHSQKLCSTFSTIRKNFTLPFLKYKRFKLKLRVFLAGHSVVLVNYCVTKIPPTYGNCDPSKYVSWKVPETVLSHLKVASHPNVTIWGKNILQWQDRPYSYLCFKKEISKKYNFYEKLWTK